MKGALILMAFAMKLVDLAINLVGLLAFPLAYKNRRTTIDEDGNPITHYPKWAWAWDNDDHGIDGQNFYAKKTTGWPYWWRCLVWSHFRNMTFNSSKYIYGIKARPYVHFGDDRVGDTKAEGSYWAFVPGHPWFEYYYVKAYTLFGSRRCLRIRIGWKMHKKSAGEDCQFCFVISPFKAYTGN